MQHGVFYALYFGYSATKRRFHYVQRGEHAAKRKERGVPAKLLAHSGAVEQTNKLTWHMSTSGAI